MRGSPVAAIGHLTSVIAPMQVNLVVAYQRTETAFAAIRLADFLLSSGMDFRLISTLPITAVHPFWDRRVCRLSAEQLAAASHIVWFNFPSADWLSLRERLRPDGHNTWVPSCDNSFGCLGTYIRQHRSLPFGLFQSVVCGSRDRFLSLRPWLPWLDVSWCPWDTGMTTVQQPKAPEGEIDIYVPISGDTSANCSQYLLAVTEQVLSGSSKLRLNLAYRARPDRRVRSQLKALTTRFRSRLQLHLSVSFLDHLQFLCQSDWTFLPDLCTEFGIGVYQSLACGSPVITYDCPPADQFVLHGRHGLLIPCESLIRENFCRTAVPSIAQTLDTISLLASERASTCYKQDWGLEVRRAAFERHWRQHFAF